MDGAWETARAGAGGSSGDSVLWRDPVGFSPLILEELVLVNTPSWEKCAHTSFQAMF